MITDIITRICPSIAIILLAVGIILCSREIEKLHKKIYHLHYLFEELKSQFARLSKDSLALIETFNKEE
jgi:hypothetical protein